MKKSKAVALVVVLFLCAGGIFLFQKINVKYPWLWMTLGDQWGGRPLPAAGPTHVLFLFTDHFEPHDQATMDRWMKAYPELARKHRDGDGKMPQHSWFWYFDKSDTPEKNRFLTQLSQLSYEGLGEVELHLHHTNDTEETFLKKIQEMIRLSRETGSMLTAEANPRTAFGFIHGLWSLDNSRGAGACGINNELILLRSLGCYADFTHPSWGEMHPRTVNRLYYATDDPEKPKSYETGPEMEVGKPALGDLLIFEGPSVLHFNSIKPAYDHGDVTHVDLPTPERIDAWVRTRIHVKDRPEWVFVKVFTHGALTEDHEAVLGAWADKMYSYLEHKYNDGKNYVLHYVSAREAYNIAKAAEAGRSGNPNLYRDFVIPPYINRFLIASAPFEVLSFSGNQVALKFLSGKDIPVNIRFRASQVAVSGDAEVKEIQAKEDETIITLIPRGNGMVGLSGRLVES